MRSPPTGTRVSPAAKGLPIPYPVFPLYLLFTISGSIGLVYESLWARYLKLFLGHSAYGQILTLCIYMGSLGIGSFLGAAIARRSRSPLYVYAGIQLIAGIGGLCFHGCYVAAADAFYGWEVLRHFGPAGITAAKVLVSVLLTSPVAILLGMTFPCLAIALMRLRGDDGRSSLPMLYFVNSLGAAAGILAASYILIASLGTAGTLRAAGIANLLLALGFFAAARSVSRQTQTLQDIGLTPTQPPGADEQPHDEHGVWFWLVVAALTGFSSFVYEVSWIRLLSLVLGSATHSFDIMVSAFILGLAFGGLYSRRLIARSHSLPLALAMVQVAMGVCAILTIYCYKPLFVAMNHSHLLFSRDDTGYVLLGMYKYLLCLLTMFPACFCAGMTLPLVTCYLTHRTGNEMYTGTVYGWNTVGAILGAALGGLVMLPVLQLRMTVAAAAFVDMMLGAAILLRIRARTRSHALAWGAAVLALAPLMFFRFESDVLVAGQYRHRASFAPREGTVVRDGATATISFQRSDSSLTLKSNGKVDASLAPLIKGERRDDEYTQAALAFVPMSLMDTAYTAAMIGFGSGMTAHHLLGDDRLRRLDIVEIEREVPRVARGFHPYNRRAYEDNRATLVIDDAKSFFHVTSARYDLIISEPTNPWVSGVAGLFTREFYARIGEFLHDDGLLIQWVHQYDFNTSLLLTIFKALEEHFPRWQVFAVPGGSDLIIAAWRGAPRPMEWARLDTMPQFRADLDFLGVEAALFGQRNYILSNKSLAPLLDSAAPNSDYIPLVENGAEKALFLDSYVDLFEPFIDNCVYYQEILEPESFAAPLRSIRAARAGEPFDTVSAGLVLARLEQVADTTDWDWLDSAFYQTVYDYAGGAAWLDIALVERYRDIVYTGLPPLDVQYRFKLVDFVSRGMHAQAAAVVSAMLNDYPRAAAGAPLIRTMAIEAYRSGDARLFSRVYEVFARANTELSVTERRFMLALREGMTTHVTHPDS